MGYAPVEGVLRGAGVTPGSTTMKEAIRICGGTEHLPERVPLERFGELLHFLARHCFSTLPLEEGLARVGACLFEGYGKTLLGQIQLAALHLIGPDRFLRKAPEFLSRSSNFGTRTTEQLGPKHWSVHFQGVPLPGVYYQGMLEAALRATGVKEPRTSVEQLGPEELKFDVRW